MIEPSEPRCRAGSRTGATKERVYRCPEPGPAGMTTHVTRYQQPPVEPDGC
jgi:hypothetical protein